MDPKKLIDNLYWRYAVKQYQSGKEVAGNKFQAILESARLAPSSMGLQPWHFFIIEDQELRNQLLEYSYKQTKVANAGHLIVLASKTTITDADIDHFIDFTAKERGQKPEDIQGLKDMIQGRKQQHTDQEIAERCQRQTYIALGFMLYTAAQLQVDTSPMEGFQADKYNEILGLTKKGYQATTLLAVGHRSPDDKYADLKKVRFPLEEVTRLIP